MFQVWRKRAQLQGVPTMEKEKERGRGRKGSTDGDHRELITKQE